MTALQTITDLSELTTCTGGMKWEQFRRSKNVEDRRSPAAKARDDAWFRAQK